LGSSLRFNILYAREGGKPSMPNREIARNGTEPIATVEADRQIIRGERQTAMRAYRRKRKREGWYRSVGDAVHYTLLLAFWESERHRDLTRRVMTPHDLLRHLLMENLLNPDREVTYRQIMDTFSRPTPQLTEHHFSIVPAAHVRFTGNTAEMITEEEATRWYTELRRNNFWKGGALLIHVLDPVFLLRQALLDHNFRLSHRGQSTTERGLAPLRGDDGGLHPRFETYRNSIRALKPREET
jgi:hypothetical protein